MFSNFCGLLRKLELYCVILSLSNKKILFTVAFHITKDKWLLKTSANLWDVLNLGNEAKNWKIISLFFHQIELKTLPLQSVNPCCVLHVKSNQKKWYFVTKIVLTYCEKKMFEWLRKTFEIRGWRPRICKIFEIVRTIYSNSERSEQFLVTKCFFNLFLEVSQTW